MAGGPMSGDLLYGLQVILLAVAVVLGMAAIMTDTYAEIVLGVTCFVLLWRLFAAFGLSLVVAGGLVTYVGLLKFAADRLGEGESRPSPAVISFLDALLTRREGTGQGQHEDRQIQTSGTKLDRDDRGRRR